MSEVGAFRRGTGAVRAVDHPLGNGPPLLLGAHLPAKLCKDAGFFVAPAFRTLVADVL